MFSSAPSILDSSNILKYFQYTFQVNNFPHLVDTPPPSFYTNHLSISLSSSKTLLLVFTQAIDFLIIIESIYLDTSYLLCN